ncbi:vgr related protein [Sphingomonas sp. M1-B02]|uniref:vgr related protein n=1 Tax=Sphingomonas sp. M1-B02 TaxID=3114300 RepID=UPI00224006A6|nr:vgr related protein [Sphingomonas sp. S6-11]UZK65975.1 basic secretory family protein [Sphingomonas sp. S6-11]
MSVPRPLTEGEIRLCASIFGSALDYSQARVANRKWAFFQPANTTMAPRGTIHFHPKSGLYTEDFAHAPLGVQGLFIHEMVHVWQHQQGIFLPLKRHPFCRYAYALKPGQKFEKYGLEQQAEIVRHAFLLRQRVVIPAAPPLAQYESLLPFTPA